MDLPRLNVSHHISVTSCKLSVAAGKMHRISLPIGPVASSAYITVPIGPIDAIGVSVSVPTIGASALAAYMTHVGLTGDRGNPTLPRAAWNIFQLDAAARARQ